MTEFRVLGHRSIARFFVLPVKEENNPETQEVFPRKHFSGGETSVDLTETLREADPTELPEAGLDVIHAGVNWRADPMIRENEDLPRRSILPGARVMGNRPAQFSTMSPEMLEGKKGVLAEVARILHTNIEALERDFTVITSSGEGSNKFPLGPFKLSRGYVALASNRTNMALFFYPGLVFFPDNERPALMSITHQDILVVEAEYDFEKRLSTFQANMTEPPWWQRFIDWYQLRPWTRFVVRADINEDRIQGFIDGFVSRNTPNRFPPVGGAQEDSATPEDLLI